MQRRTNLGQAELSLLHFAPEAILKRRLSEVQGLRYTTADLDSELADLRFDITAIPLEDNSVDLVLCSHVLEHVSDDRAALREIRRILKAGGAALVLTPVDQQRQDTFEDPTIVSPQERAHAYWQADHVRLYGQDLPERLEAAGFEATRVRFTQSFDMKSIRRYGLGWNDDVYVCRKPIRTSAQGGRSMLRVDTNSQPAGPPSSPKAVA